MIILEIIGAVVMTVLVVASVLVLIVALVPLAILIIVGIIAGFCLGIGFYTVLVMFVIELYRDSRREIKKLPRDIII